MEDRIVQEAAITVEVMLALIDKCVLVAADHQR